jgi:hypothetical protein
VTVPAVRDAIMMVAARRRLQLSEDDITALVAAAVGAQATAWVGDEEAMALTGRSNVKSLRDFCFKYGVTRKPMLSRPELEAALASKVGRGRYPREGQP